MVFDKIRNSFSVLKQISFLGVAHVIPTLIAASFWFYIASLIGDEAYGEITYYYVDSKALNGYNMLNFDKGAELIDVGYNNVQYIKYKLC